MSMTLLEMVQDISSEMGSFRPNDINDNSESRRVVQVIKECFNRIHSYRYWPMDEKLINLGTLYSNGSLIPNVLTIPANVSNLSEVYYDGKLIQQVANGDMLRWMMRLNKSSGNVERYTLMDSPIYCVNDKKPMMFSVYTAGTSDDLQNVMVFDAYDAGEAQSLLSSKANVLAYVPPAFQERNNYVPEMPEKAYPFLLAEARARAFLTIKQMANEAAAADARRLRSWLAVDGDLGTMSDTYPNYGRK